MIRYFFLSKELYGCKHGDLLLTLYWRENDMILFTNILWYINLSGVLPNES